MSTPRAASDANGAMTAVIWLLLLVPFAASIGAQKLVRSTYRRYRAVPNHAGLAGAEIARALLDAHGLQRVRIRPAPGSLSDNYDGDRKRLALSQAVAAERSVSAMGIASHEVAHAYQDAEGDRAYRARRAIAEPLTGLADASEQRGVRRVLAAAGTTYVVGLFDRLGYFFALLFVAEAMRRYAIEGEASWLVPF